jgi:hypothetical protein
LRAAPAKDDPPHDQPNLNERPTVTHPIVSAPADKTVHEHIAGSAGGPGDNSAECACGVVFDGFDTHADAMAVLNAHIAGAARPDPFIALAAELHRIADDLRVLAYCGLPTPGHFELNIQPGGRGDGDKTRKSVDAIAEALLEKRGELRPMSDGSYHYHAKGFRGAVSVALYQSVPTEWAKDNEAAMLLAAREAELEKLRAEVECLRELGASR